jgi:hypothetical protein
MQRSLQSHVFHEALQILRSLGDGSLETFEALQPRFAQVLSKIGNEGTVRCAHQGLPGLIIVLAQ